MIEFLIGSIKRESKNQYEKFGYQNHTFELWYMILMEEIAEISQEYIAYITDKPNSSYDNVRNEMIQSITLLTQMLLGFESFDFFPNKNLIGGNKK